MIQDFFCTGKLLIFSAILFFIYILWNVWLSGRFAPDYSPIIGNLKDRGYDSTFGIVVATIYPLIVIGTCILLTVFNVYEIDFVQVAVGTLILYIFFAIALNIWAKNYLKRKGIDPKPKDGYKGFVQNYKEALEKAKEKQRKKKEESLF